MYGTSSGLHPLGPLPHFGLGVTGGSYTPDVAHHVLTDEEQGIVSTVSSSTHLAHTQSSGDTSITSQPLSATERLAAAPAGILACLLCLLANAWAAGIVVLAHSYEQLALSGPDVSVPFRGIAALFAVAGIELIAVWVAWARLGRRGARTKAPEAGLRLTDTMRAEGFEPPTPAL